MFGGKTVVEATSHDRSALAWLVQATRAFVYMGRRLCNLHTMAAELFVSLVHSVAAPYGAAACIAQLLAVDTHGPPLLCNSSESWYHMDRVIRVCASQLPTVTA